MMQHGFYLCLSVVIVSLFAFNSQALGIDEVQQQRIQLRQELQRNQNNQNDVSRDYFDRGANLGRELKRSVPPIRGGRAGVVAAVLATCAAGVAYIYAYSTSTAGASVATVAVVLFFIGIFYGYCSEGSDETAATYEALDDPVNDEPMEPSFSELLNVTFDFD